MDYGPFYNDPAHHYAFQRKCGKRSSRPPASRHAAHVRRRQLHAEYLYLRHHHARFPPVGAHVGLCLTHHHPGRRIPRRILSLRQPYQSILVLRACRQHTLSRPDNAYHSPRHGSLLCHQYIPSAPPHGIQDHNTHIPGGLLHIAGPQLRTLYLRLLQLQRPGPVLVRRGILGTEYVPRLPDPGQYGTHPAPSPHRR